MIWRPFCLLICYWIHWGCLTFFAIYSCNLQRATWLKTCKKLNLLISSLCTAYVSQHLEYCKFQILWKNTNKSSLQFFIQHSLNNFSINNKGLKVLIEHITKGLFVLYDSVFSFNQLYFDLKQRIGATESLSDKDLSAVICFNLLTEFFD